jgi:hypothetical protein
MACGFKTFHPKVFNMAGSARCWRRHWERAKIVAIEIADTTPHGGAIS